MRSQRVLGQSLLGLAVAAPLMGLRFAILEACEGPLVRVHSDRTVAFPALDRVVCRNVFATVSESQEVGVKLRWGAG